MDTAGAEAARAQQGDGQRRGPVEALQFEDQQQRRNDLADVHQSAEGRGQARLGHLQMTTPPRGAGSVTHAEVFQFN